MPQNPTTPEEDRKFLQRGGWLSILWFALLMPAAAFEWDDHAFDAGLAFGSFAAACLLSGIALIACSRSSWVVKDDS